MKIEDIPTLRLFDGQTVYGRAVGLGMFGGDLRQVCITEALRFLYVRTIVTDYEFAKAKEQTRRYGRPCSFPYRARQSGMKSQPRLYDPSPRT